MSTSPSPLSHITPILLFEQTAPTSRRPTHQQSQNSHVPRTETRRTREDNQRSWGRIELRSRGYREAVDKDGEGVDVHRADIAPQQPQTTHTQTVQGQQCQNAEEEDEKGGRASESAALSSNDDGGDEDVRHAYVIPKLAPPFPNHVPPPPDESRPPPSVPLEGEKNGQHSSGHADEAATHLERPPDESTTTLPVWTPPDEKSSGEGQGTAMSHREAVGARDEVKVEGSRDDEEHQENREEEVRMGDEAKHHNDAANGEGEDEHSPRTPPQPPPSSPLSPPPPIPPTSPPYPERRGDDIDTTKSNKTPA
ncbi:hypothetical protein PAXINDRAFT_13078 [Paxillus involutus ATCC 200175]|uniref:Uncharacterized protein n=1 Tax=Paxillus involutus ATCC 200175 TaxID=664439 RepID=A0A0C9TF27_PAXIN|nr:hypothetical protein PAXINDRAFT_13078 [Paxillus involutus ATCC 200175]